MSKKYWDVIPPEPPAKKREIKRTDPADNIKKIQEFMDKLNRENREVMPYRLPRNEQPCLHKGCGTCHGTGINPWGGLCVHALSCPCPSCSPTMMMAVRN